MIWTGKCWNEVFGRSKFWFYFIFLFFVYLYILSYIYVEWLYMDDNDFNNDFLCADDVK